MSMARELNRTRMAEAAYTNERATRERMTVAERRIEAHEKWLQSLNHVLVADVRTVIYDRNLWGRLKWLVLGR